MGVLRTPVAKRKSDVRGESRAAFKVRLQGDGRWGEFVRRREEAYVAAGGARSRREIWEEMKWDYPPAAKETEDVLAWAARGEPSSAESSIEPSVEQPAEPSAEPPVEPPVLMAPVSPPDGGRLIGSHAPVPARQKTPFAILDEEISAEDLLDWVVSNLDTEDSDLGEVPNRKVLAMLRWAQESASAKSQVFKEWFEAQDRKRKQSGRMFQDDGRELGELISRVKVAAEAAAGGVIDDEEPY